MHKIKAFFASLMPKKKVKVAPLPSFFRWQVAQFNSNSPLAKHLRAKQNALD